jgi:catechol 2,3-dioxygenase-like lactoylglutathione lyase family enzyme
MGIRGLHHIVVTADDVPADEAFYRDLFDMEVLFREGTLDGDPGTVPEDVAWDEAVARGVDPYMSFLGRDDFFLAVANGNGATTGGRVDHVALSVDEPTFESITERAGQFGCEVERNASHHRTIQDRLGIEWELNSNPRPPGPAFDTLDL